MMTDLDNRSSVKLHLIKTKFMHSENVPTGRVLIGSDEIEKLLVYFWSLLNICQDMDEKNSLKIKSWWKVFTTIKVVFKAKLGKTKRTNLFYNIVVHAGKMYNATEKDE